MPWEPRKDICVATFASSVGYNWPEQSGWVRSIRDGVRERGTYRSYQNMSLVSLCDLLSTGRQLWSVLFITNLKWNLFASLTTSNSTATNCIISYAQNATLLQPVVFLTGIDQFLITSGDRLSQRKLPTSATFSSVIISTGLRVEGPKIRSCSSIIFSFPDCPYSFLGPPSFLYGFGHQE